jgi:lipopolysaccharide export LptBFGC system permease protein LptF
VVITFFWAFREFLICWAPCPDRSAIIAERTQQAVAMTVLLAINLVGLVVFLLSRRRIGLRVLGGVQIADIAVTLGFGIARAVSDNDFSSGFGWWAGSVIAAVTLLLVYLRTRDQGARRPSAAA